MFRDSFDSNMGVAILRSSGSEGLDLTDRLRKFYNITSNEIKPLNKKKTEYIKIIDETNNKKCINLKKKKLN